MSTLNEVIRDTDNDTGRLRLGKEISRPRKKKDVKNYERRRVYKQKLRDGNLTPWHYLQAISNTIGNIYTDINNPLSDSESSGDKTSEDTTVGTTVENSCVVCLSPRTPTWLFLPHRHANCCSNCNQQIKELGQTCPVCRSAIDSRLQIFTN